MGFGIKNILLNNKLVNIYIRYLLMVIIDYIRWISLREKAFIKRIKISEICWSFYTFTIILYKSIGNYELLY